jgi:ABC-2 family transporter protein
MQLISGCSALAYWGGHFLWDATTHLGLSVLSVAIFAAFGDEATTGSGEKVWQASSSDALRPVLRMLCCINSCSIRACLDDSSSMPQVAAGFLLLLMYGLAVIPLAYCQGFSFSNPTAAQA